jgi:hypothetical protein
MDNTKLYYSTRGKWGTAIDYTIVKADGTMWVGNGEYETRVNYCPWTGEKAPVQMTVLETGKAEYKNNFPYTRYIDYHL